MKHFHFASVAGFVALVGLVDNVRAAKIFLENTTCPPGCIPGVTCDASCTTCSRIVLAPSGQGSLTVYLTTDAVDTINVDSISFRFLAISSSSTTPLRINGQQPHQFEVKKSGLGYPLGNGTYVVDTLTLTNTNTTGGKPDEINLLIETCPYTGGCPFPTDPTPCMANAAGTSFTNAAASLPCGFPNVLYLGCGGGPCSGNSCFTMRGESVAQPIVVNLVPTLDCNQNGVEDTIEIFEGTLADCQPNAYPDICDIGDGYSTDVNANGIPDECEQPTPTGACCGLGEVCVVLTQFDCEASSGVYQGDGTTCDPDPCIDCCSDHPEPGCGEIGGFPAPGVAECVCAFDPACCTASWDLICASEVDIFGCGTCPTGACCDFSFSCFDGLTHVECQSAPYLGTYLGDNTTCAANPCLQDPQFDSSCCLPDGGCLDNISQSECEVSLGGLYVGGQLCSAHECFGSCCLPDCDPICLDGTNYVDCSQFFQGWFNPGLACDEVDCLGACCYPDGNCIDNFLACECEFSGGNFLGIDSVCPPEPCAEPTGACCLLDCTCLDGVTEDHCESVLGGSYGGDFSICDQDVDCTGACCYPDGHCVPNSLFCECEETGGEFLGLGSACPLSCVELPYSDDGGITLEFPFQEEETPAPPSNPCEGNNYLTNAFNDNILMGGPLVGISWVPNISTPILINRIELFTGETVGPMALAIWSDNAGQPGVNLAHTTTVPTVLPNSWQGADLSDCIVIEPFTQYWIVYDPTGGEQSPVQQVTTGQTYWGSYVGSVTGGASWFGPFTFPDHGWKFRMFCCACVAPPPGMEAWWTGDDCGPTDIVGPHDGTYLGFPDCSINWKVGGGAMDFFPGTYVTVPHSPDLDVGCGPWSYDAWIYWNGTAGGSLASKYGDDGFGCTRGYSWFVNATGNLCLALETATGPWPECNGFRCVECSTGTVPANTWTHVAVVFSGSSGSFTFYIDGVADSTFTTSCTCFTNTAPLLIGNSDFVGGNWDGLIDELEFFRRELDSTEIEDVFQAGSAGKCRCTPAPPDMAAWWQLNELAGSVAAELLHGNNGAHVNGPTPLAGEWVANSLCLNGVNQYVEVPDAPELNFGTGDLSLDAWIKTTSASSVEVIVDKRVEATDTTGYSLFLSSGNLSFQLADGGGGSSICASCPTSASCTNYVSTAFVADGVWHHVAVTVDRDLITGGTFYVDGQMVAGTFDPTCHPGTISNNNPLRIGSRSSSVSGLFNGCVDEVELFTRVLSEDEVEAIYKAQKAGKCIEPCIVPPTDMLSWWPLDELTGTVAADVVGGHNATYIGNPLPHSVGRVLGALEVDPANHPQTGGTPYNFGTHGFTIDAWVKLSTGNIGELWIVDRGHEFHFAANSSPFSPPHLEWDCGLNFWPSPIPTDVWTHLAVTVDGPSITGGLKMYTDGVLVGSTNTCAYNVNYGAIPLNIGAGTGGPSRLIDEVEVFDRGLDASEIRAIYDAGYAGKCKTPCTCHVPWDRPICINDTSIVVEMSICNNSSNFSDEACCYDLTFDDLPVSLPDCTINGPTTFTVLSGTPVCVPPQTCVLIEVQIDRPAGSPINIGCYEMLAQSLSGGPDLRCQGSVVLTDDWCCTFPAPPDGNPLDLALGAPVELSFEVENMADDGESLDYEIVVMPSDMAGDVALVSLNGLPPGEPVIGTLLAPIGGSQTVSVSAAILTLEVGRFYDVILFADMDHNGTLEPLGSHALRAAVPCATALVSNEEDFEADHSGWTLIDSAEAVSGVARLVASGETFSAGVATHSVGYLTDDFDIEFEFEISNPVGGVPDGSGDSDPDGFAFFVTGAPVTVAGGVGFGLGYKDFPLDSFAIEFDSFHNFVGGSQPDDPDSNHIGLDVGGSVESMSTAFLTPDFDETGRWHARIRFQGGIVLVYVTPPSGSEFLAYTEAVPLVNIPVIKYFGFSSGTGINSGDTDIDNVTLRLLDAACNLDCNANGVLDAADIAKGMSADENANGVPDECEAPPPCEGDANGDATVDPLDAGYILSRFGCTVGAGDPDCDAADVNHDGVVDPLDSGFVLARFGPCP